MMNICSRQPRKTGNTATLLMVLAVFFSLFSSARSQTNSVTGTAYGTNDISTAATIRSVTDGEGYLAIGYAGTTSLILSNNISGTISIDSRFSSMDILATGSTVSNWQDVVLSITGGTNLTLTDGRFIGLPGTNTFNRATLPGPGAQFGYATNAAAGGWLNGVRNGTLSNTWFEGATYAPLPNVIIGTDALMIGNSTNILITGDDSLFAGGSGGDITSATSGALSLGARGLLLTNSTASISSGTFQGGHAGRASAGDGYQSSSFGGNGIRVIDSELHIIDGAFTGGDAESAMVNQGGLGLFATDSNMIIDGGIFTGGMDAAGKRSYGLFSMVTGGGTNHLVFSGGTYNLLGFGGSGTQYLTIGTNGLTVADGVNLDGGTLNVTNLNNAPFQNTSIFDGTMNFSENFTLEGGGQFYVSSFDTMVGFAQDYRVMSGTTNWFTATTNGTGSMTADNMYFHTGSAIGIDNKILGLPAGVSITSTVASATSGLHVVESGGITNTNPTADLFRTNVNVFSTLNGRSGLSDIILSDHSLAFEFSTLTLSNYWNAAGAFAVLADELDALTNRNSSMLALIDELADPGTSGSLVQQTYFTSFNVFQTARQGMQAAIGQSASRSAEFREQLKLKPAGARGPQDSSDLRGWIKYFSERSEQDAAGLNPSYESKLEGGTVGIDKSLGGLLLGISGGAGRYTTTDGFDGKSDIDAYYGSVYGTLEVADGYIDGGIMYGLNKVDTRTATPFVLYGDFDAELTGAYLGAGYDLVDNREGMVFTPELAVQYSMYEQEAYTETGDATIPRRFDAFEADSLLGSVGLNMSILNTIRMETFSLKYDIRAHWMHEFNPEPGSIEFILDGGNNRYQFDAPMLDEDIYRVGAGIAFFNTLSSQPDNVLLRIDYDKLFGDGFDSHRFSAKFIYAF